MRRTALSSVAVLAVAPLAAITTWAAASPASPPAHGAPPTMVHLITGDRVVVGGTSAHPQIDVLPRTHHGIAGQIATFSHGGEVDVLPGAARRYLGSVLDPSLFDVTALARTGTPDRVQVVVTRRPGSTPHVPGLTVVSRSGSVVRGYLTPTGTRAFGAALAAAWRSDARAHRVAHTLFGGVTRIAAPGAVTAHPDFPQLTLAIHVIAPSGRPAGFASVVLTNVDDGRKFTAFLDIVRGLAKVSVPVGNYSGLAEYDAFTPSSIRSFLVPLEEVPVSATQATMTFDMRTATSVPSVATPRPARAQTETLEWDRNTTNFSVGYGITFGGGSRVSVAPSGPATEGQLHWLSEWQLAADPQSGPPYTYDLAFDSEGRVPVDQSHSVAAADLTTVDSRYYTDQQPRLAVFGRGAFFPFQFFVFTELLPLQTPTERLEYVNDPPGARWVDSLIAASGDQDPFQGDVEDGDNGYQPGTTVHADWLAGPLAPGMPEPTPGTSGFFCGYCRGPNSVSLFFAPVTDTTPAHAGSFDAPFRGADVAHFSLFRDGVRIASAANSTGARVPVPDGRASYRAVVTTQRGEAGFATSTSAREVVRFVSSATSGRAAPPHYFCTTRRRTCTVLPLLTAKVPLPTDLSGTMPLGPNTVTFVVRHLQGAASSPLVDVRFAVTPDEGQTYYSLPVTSLGGDEYQVTLHNRPGWAGHGIGIQVAADDAVGGALTETVNDAYYVAQS